MLTAAYIIPHHHHDGMFCMIMEHCKEDGNINDEHTHHHDDHQAPDHSCIVKTHYITPKVYNHVNFNVASCNSFTHDHVFPLLYVVHDCLILNSEFSKIKPEYGEYIRYYNSATASRLHGLRAPPFVS